LSKSILRVGLLIAAVAVQFIPGIGQAVGAALLISAGAATAGIEIALVLAGSLLLGPSGPKGSLTNTAQGRLYATLVTTEPRKIVFGNTAGGNDVRYQTYTGSKQEFYHQVIVHASHQVQSIDEIWIDNEKAWSKTGGVLGRYAGWLTVTTRELATSGNGIAIDGVWTASCTLTGCAYTYLQYKLLDTANAKNQSPFQSGVTGRLTFRGNGALTYDPRLDSTVSGGSGTQRAGTQTTWAWSATASRNPALQLLWYLLGWQINGKIALGMGLPAARIDLPSFITAANRCDESVPLAAGGSEPRYRGDGLVSEGDDRSAVIQHLCQTMNATMRDSGGKIALQVINNDLATPVATFGLNDILGQEQYEQTQPLNNYFNIVRGRRVDATDQALYQLTDFPQVVLTSPDGIDRIQTTDFPLVQANGQAQRLAKLSLKRAQYQAKYTAAFGSNAWAVSLGNIVQINHAGMNWTNKLMRVVAQSIGQNGQVKMTLLEESTDVYSWAAEDVAGTIGGTPTAVVPTSLPIPASLISAGLSADANGGIIDSGNTGGTITLPRSEVRTSIGTAAAIASQGTLATRNWGRLGLHIRRADDTTVVNDADAITSQGTAANIAGQGSFATISSAAYGSSYLTGFGSLAARAHARLGLELYRSDDTTVINDADAITSLGTSAGFTGQKRLATIDYANYDTDVVDGTTYNRYRVTERTKLGGVQAGATVGSRFNVNAYRNDGTTLVNDAIAVTSLGTAANIAGQGGFATISSAAYGSSFLTGFGALATKATISVDADLSGNVASRLTPHPLNAAYISNAALLYASGVGIENLKPGEAGANITENRVAASISGQAATATNADFAAVTGSTKPSNNADVTAATIPSLNGNTDFQIAANSAGTITTTLPFTRQFTALKGTTDVSTTTTWALSGGYAALALSVDANGLLTVGTGSTGSGTATLTATLPSGAGTVTKTLTFTKTNAPAPAYVPPSGAVTSGTITSLTAPTTTTSTAVSAEVRVTSDATGKIKISMDIFYSATNAPSISRIMYANLAYATTSGGALTDVFADTVPGDTATFYSSADHLYNDGEVYLALTQYTMPAANTDYYFKVKARLGNAAYGANPYNAYIAIQQV
jgi:hypothetical protein